MSVNSNERFDAMLTKANVRLKPHKVCIEKRGDMLSLRATLPIAGKEGTKQQRIPLKIPALPAYLKTAEDRALLLAGQKATGTFTWEFWEPTKESISAKSDKQTIKEWIEKFRIEVLETGTSSKTWKRNYLPSLKKLPGTEVPTEDVFIKAICSNPQNSYARIADYGIFKRFIGFIGISVDLKRYRGNYKQKPRELPSDQEIIEIAELIANLRTCNQAARKWAWIFKVCATYGLRPCEVFFCKINKDFPYDCSVLKGKTGKRIVKPLYPEWVERWQLWNADIPNVKIVDCLTTMGTKASAKISDYFADNPDIFPQRYCLYDLRHAYAIRGSVKLGIPIRVMAGLMGHSPTEHLKTYSKWLNNKDATEIYLKAIESRR